MATSQWLLVAATLAMLFIGSTDAWTKCSKGLADCKPRVPGCETNIFKDPKNCGKCGNCCKQVSNAVTSCKYGKCCEPECNLGYGNCDGNIWKNGCEKSLLSDPLNCGKCGNCCKQVPNAVTLCKSGKCFEPECKPGYGNCDGNIWKNGCEKSLLSDPLNCGKCGNCCKQVPNAVTLCKSGKCSEPECNPGYGNCDGNIWKNGCEKSLLSDPLNCGKCGNCCKQVPNAVTLCKSGKCSEPECNPGYGNCDGNIWKNGCEKSLLSDSLNCGKCGNCCKQVPNAVTLCKSGKCSEPECNPGYGNCDGNIWKNGCEKSLSNDIFNCGKCGYCCPVTLKGGEATCSAGVCGQQCKAGTQYDSVNKCCVPIPKH